ncbi:response regulator [Planctomycetota bacterium]
MPLERESRITGSSLETRKPSTLPSTRVSIPVDSRFNIRAVRLKVLVVEDGLVNRTLILGLLKKRQHLVTTAENGQEAVEAVRAQTFDVILMDVEMPTMDGLAATRMIRAMEDANDRHVPIIGVTTMDRQACIDAGMDDHLKKSEVSQRLDEMLAKHTLVHGVAYHDCRANS